MDKDAGARAAERDAEVAASLMRMALALLDRAGECLVAVRLQHAIDSLERWPRDDPADFEPEAASTKEGG